MKLSLWDLPRLVKLYQDAQKRRRLMKHPHLNYLFWESTHRCNLCCAHCGSRCGPSARPTEELLPEQVKHIFSTIAEDFDARQILVSITGGEPLLREDLEEQVAHMVQLGMTVCMVSNGTLLTEARAQALKQAGMSSVSISLDGLKTHHERIRGQGTYEAALRAIRNARAAGFECVEAITCVRPVNVPDLPELERQIRAAGADNWRLFTIDCMGRAADEDPPESAKCDKAADSTCPASTDDAEVDMMWLGGKPLHAMLDFLTQRRKALKRADDPFEIQFACGGFMGPHEGDWRPIGNQCGAGLNVGSVLYDGQVSACPSLPRSLVQGSALTTRFSKIWRDRFVLHRDLGWRRSDPCGDCSWFELCLGGGLHERLAQPDDFCWLQRLES